MKYRSMLSIKCRINHLMVGSLALATSVLFAANAYAEIQTRTIFASTTTGWNKNFASPIAKYPGDVGIFGFRTIGQYNPNGNVIPITGPLPDSTLISTFVDPEWAERLGFPPEALANVKNNIPLREVPVRIDAGGFNKKALSELANQGQMGFGLASPAYPITLGDWLRARGRIDITCFDHKYAHIKGTFSGLVPNHIYTFREWFRPNGSQFIVVPGVLGGAPASFIADKYGNGEYFIKLPSCPPMSADNVDHPFIAIAITVSFAHESGGLVPVLPLHPTDPSFPGERAFGQLHFPLNGERIVPGAGPVSDIRDWPCKHVRMLDSDLVMESPTAPAIGRAKVLIGGALMRPKTEVAFVRPPQPRVDGTLGFLATLRYEFENDDVLEGLIEGTFIPTDDPYVVKNRSKARFVGGANAYDTAIGDFRLGGKANFETLVANLTGKGEVCGPREDDMLSSN